MELYLQVTDGKLFDLDNLFYIIDKNPDKYLKYIEQEKTLFNVTITNEFICLRYLYYYLDFYKLSHPSYMYTLNVDIYNCSKIESFLNIKKICHENHENFVKLQTIAKKGSEFKILDDNFFNLFSIKASNLFIFLYLHRYHTNIPKMPSDLMQLLEYINNDDRSISKITLIKLGYIYIPKNDKLELLFRGISTSNHFSNQYITEDIEIQKKIILSYVSLEDFTNQEIIDNLQEMLFFFTENEISKRLDYIAESPDNEIQFARYYYYNLEGEKLEYFEEPCVLISKKSHYKNGDTFITKINKKYKKRLESGFVTNIQLYSVQSEPKYYSKFEPDNNTVFFVDNVSLDYELGEKIYYNLVNSKLNFVEFFDIMEDKILDILRLFNENTYKGIELRNDIIIKIAGESEKLENYLVNNNFY